MIDRFNENFRWAIGLLVTGLFGLATVDWPWVAEVPLLIWLFLAVGIFVWLQDEPRRAGVLTLLKDPHEGSWYKAIVTRVSKWPRDWRCYDWALRISVVYPILLIVGVWAFTWKAGLIGSVEFLPALDSWSVAVAISLAISAAALATFAKRFAAASRNSTFKRYSDQLLTYLLLVAFWVSFTFVGTGAGVATGALAAAFAGSGVFTFAFSAAFSVAFAVANLLPGQVEELSLVLGSMLASFAVAFTAAHVTLGVSGRGKGVRAYFFFIGLMVTTLTLTLFMLPWADMTQNSVSIFFFIGLLPLLNSLTDYLSYVVTFWLVDRGRRSGSWAFLMALADIGAALLICAALGVLLVVVVAGANAVAGVPLFRLAPLFDDLRAHPDQYFWLYAMLFSTLVPTVVHLVVAGFSMVALPFLLAGKLPMNRWITAPDSATTFAPPFFLGLAGTLSILAPFLLGWGLYHGVSAIWGDVAQHYLDQMEGLAVALGET